MLLGTIKDKTYHIQILQILLIFKKVVENQYFSRILMHFRRFLDAKSTLEWVI